MELEFTLTTLLILAIGAVGAGLLAGLFGVGGGIIFVPLLVFALSADQLAAQVTSLAAIIPVAAIGTWRQARSDLINWRVTTFMAIGAAVGVLAGAEVATRVDGETLARAFGALLLLIGSDMAIRAARRLRAART
jgi:uncharacterized membrane protein YfcA